MHVGELLEFKNICAQHPQKADRNPALVAHWEGGSCSRIEFKGMTIHLGGDDEFNPMQMFLATLAACDADLIAMHASFLGLKLESLSVEATGHFNVRSYLGLDGAPGSEISRNHSRLDRAQNRLRRLSPDVILFA